MKFKRLRTSTVLFFSLLVTLASSAILGFPAFGQSISVVDNPDARTTLIVAIKNARASKKVKLVSKGTVNNAMEEDAHFEFLSPNRYYQKITKKKADGTVSIEKIKIGRQTFELIDEKWVLDRDPIFDVKDNFLSALAPVLANLEAKLPKLNSLKVEQIDSETVNKKETTVFLYELDNNWLCYQGKVWIFEGLPIKAEMWTPDGSLNKINSSTTYDYDAEVVIENPIAKASRNVRPKR
jgi:hypothetical protein